MFANTDPDAGLELFVGILKPLALPDRIEDQCDVPQSGQALGKSLVLVGGLSVVRMSTRRTWSTKYSCTIRGNRFRAGNS